MRIVLIHGQGRTPLAMSLLGWRLNRQRYKIHYFGYATPTETFEAITQRLVRFIGRKIGPRPYAIVAHSLGGIITRASLPYLDNNPPRHLVMLAPPNQPALIAKKARANALYRLVTRDCGRKLSDEAFYQTLPLPTVPTTIIAGTKGLSGRFSPFGKQANDTILSVPETRLGEGYEVILVPASHSFIMNSKQVTEVVLDRLAVKI
jgi:pimeloyl-ACP methyl ester carboxylesterase